MPFDQIYWNSGTSFRETGEFESSGTKDARIGETANGNPNSTFSFLGNRRTQILNNAVKIGVLGSLPASSRKLLHYYHNVGSGGGEIANPAAPTSYSGGLVNSMTAADIPATAPVGTTLFDCQNRESAHHSAQDVFHQNVTNSFNGLHSSDPISITTTGKPYKGAYIVLKRKKYIYSEFEIGTDQGTLQTTVDDPDGGTINVTDAVIDPRMSPKLPVYTSAVNYKHINIKLNGDVVKPTENVVVANTDLSWIDATTATQTPTCNISGTTITLNNTFQSNGEHRRYFTTDFQIRIGGTDYNITAVASASITVNSAPGNATGQAFSIIIPKGAPGISDTSHVNDSSTTAVGNTSTVGWGEFSWGMYSNKHLGGTILFEDTDTYDASSDRDSTEGWWYIATRSPYFSNKDGEDFAVIDDGFFGFRSFSASWNSYSNSDAPSRTRYVSLVSATSKAIFPHYNNNLNLAPFPADVNQTSDPVIAAALVNAGIVNQYQYFDNPTRVDRAHGLGYGNVSALDLNSSLLNKQASERNGLCYPYAAAQYGYRDKDVDSNGGTDDLQINAQDDAQCMTILDTDRVIPPGTVIEVTLQMANGGAQLDGNVPFNGDYFSTPSVGNDTTNYSRFTKGLHEFEIFIIAK